jgi:hypothetical protein
MSVNQQKISNFGDVEYSGLLVTGVGFDAQQSEALEFNQPEVTSTARQLLCFRFT